MTSMVFTLSVVGATALNWYSYKFFNVGRSECSSRQSYIYPVISGVKYLSKNTLKYYLSSFLGYLYFTLLIIFLTTFTSIHSLRKYSTFYSIHFP